MNNILDFVPKNFDNWIKLEPNKRCEQCKTPMLGIKKGIGSRKRCESCGGNKTKFNKENQEEKKNDNE